MDRVGGNRGSGSEDPSCKLSKQRSQGGTGRWVATAEAEFTEERGWLGRSGQVEEVGIVCVEIVRLDEHCRGSSWKPRVDGEDRKQDADPRTQNYR